MPRPIEALISHSALRHNLARVRREAPGSKVWAVVKANAYGHGIERALPAFADAEGLAMLDLNEALRVREAGYDRDVLLLEGIFDERDLEPVRALHLTVAVHSHEQIELLRRMPAGAAVPVYLKINTGMNRLGFAPRETAAVFAALRAMSQVGPINFMTHFANAELAHGADDAMARFDQATAGLPGARSLANSAATLLQPATRRDWVRPGIMLYGASPSDTVSAAGFGLRAAMTLKSAIIAVQQLEPGDAIGYGSRFTATASMRAGVIACGYADGYPRVAAERTPVFVAGRRVPLIGRVSMDMITVDLSAVPEARVGSEVELWGEQLAVDEVAACAGTSGYELLCALAPRVPVKAVS